MNITYAMVHDTIWPLQSHAAIYCNTTVTQMTVAQHMGLVQQYVAIQRAMQHLRPKHHQASQRKHNLGPEPVFPSELSTPIFPHVAPEPLLSPELSASAALPMTTSIDFKTCACAVGPSKRHRTDRIRNSVWSTRATNRSNATMPPSTARARWLTVINNSIKNFSCSTPSSCFLKWAPSPPTHGPLPEMFVCPLLPHAMRQWRHPT